VGAGTSVTAVVVEGLSLVPDFAFFFFRCLVFINMGGCALRQMFDFA